MADLSKYTNSVIEEMTNDQKLDALFKMCIENSKILNAMGDIRKEMDDLKTEVNERCEITETKVTSIEDRLTLLEKAHSTHSTATNKRFVLNDLHGKKFNLLFHGVEDTNLEEDMATKTANAEYILDELLCIPDYKNKIKIVDTHRLPQKPIATKKTRSSRPVCRPIVIKVSSKTEVDLVFAHLKNLSTVNDGKQQNERIYCTKHLPREMQRQRKAQMPKFKKARSEEKTAKFQIDYKTGDYRLYIDSEIVPLPKIKPVTDEY